MSVPDYWPNSLGSNNKMVEKDSTNPKDLLGVKKSPLHLVPPALWIWVAEVFKFSAPKYGPFNWREKKVRKSIYLDAIGRHLLALMDGYDFDEESELPHLAHIGANVAILLDADAQGNLINDLSYPRGTAVDVMRDLTVTSEIKIGGTR